MANSPSSKPPRGDIPLFKVALPPPEVLMPRLQSVLYSGQISEGEPVAAFERGFGELVGNPHCLSFYSGTAALHIALLLAGVEAILHAGATPRWADVDPTNGNLSAETVAAAITPRTRAILVVHYGGIPAPIAGINAVAARHGIPVIEDAAHALGARYDGRVLGSHSAFVMFSLQAIKHMTTVDGGMLTCSDPALLPKGRRLRWFGIDRHAPRTEVDVSEIGFKYHMNNVNATIGLAQLEVIQPLLDRHCANGRYLDAALAGVRGLEICRFEDRAAPSYWFYTVLCDDPDGLSKHLAAHGIASSKAHKRNDLHSVFASNRRELPGLDRFYARMLHLPCGWWVDDASREYMVEVLQRGW